MHPYDYANSVLLGTSAKNMQHLHRIQSSLARVVTQQRGRISITNTFKQLHWLPVKYRIDFKMATLTYKVLQTGEPSYLSSRISVDTPRRVLRSSTDTCRLAIPQFKTKIGSRAFRHSAPSIWNSLPFDIRNSPSTQSFKKTFKDTLFSAFLRLMTVSIRAPQIQLF